MVAGIYLITNKINDHKYVGGSVDIERRFREHKCFKDLEHQAIDRAIKKYGKENFTYQIITELPADWKIIGEHEKYWIKFYNTFKDRQHYNLNEGGDTIFYGDMHPFFGKKRPEHSERMSGENNPFYNQKHTIELRNRFSEERMGNNNPNYRGDIPTGEFLYHEKKDSDLTNRELASKYNCGETTIQNRIAKYKKEMDTNG